MKRKIYSGGAFLVLILLLSFGIASAQGTGAGGPGSNIISGIGPSFWNHNPHTDALNDYLSQTNTCQVFYAKTDSLRNEYYSKNPQYRKGEGFRRTRGMPQSTGQPLSLAERIESQQPSRFSCPW